MYIANETIAKTENTSSTFLIQNKNGFQTVCEENETLKKQQAILLRKIAELEKSKKQLSDMLKRVEDENDDLLKELGKAKERLRRYKSSIQYEILSEETLMVDGDSKSQLEKVLVAEQSCKDASKTSSLEIARRLKKKKIQAKVQERSFMKRDPNRIWFAKRRKPKKKRALPQSQTVQEDETEFPCVLVPKLDLDWKYSTWLLPNLTGCVLATNFSETESRIAGAGSSGVDPPLATESVKAETRTKTKVTNRKALPAVKDSESGDEKKVNKVQNSKENNGILKTSSEPKKKVLSVSKNGICKNSSSDTQQPLDAKKHVHFTKNEYTCTTCDERFSSKIVFSAHLRLHMNDKLKCPDCGKSFKYKSRLETHLSSHSDERPYSCTLCSKTFKYPYRLKEHLRNDHRQKAVAKNRTCPLCKCSFESENVYKNHMREHDKNPYHCKRCKRIFGTQSEYKKHASVECENAKNTQKNDKRSTERKQKERSPSPSAPTSAVTAVESENGCDKCGKTFRHTFQLVSHRERLHNEVALIDSTDYCVALENDEESNPLAEIEVDEPKATALVCDAPLENVLYACLACGHICSSEYELQTHQLTHVVSAAVVLYTCTVCGKSFNCTSSLLEHQHVHDDEECLGENSDSSASVVISDESTVLSCVTTYDGFLNIDEGTAEDRVVPEEEEEEAILIGGNSEVETTQQSEPEHMDPESRSASALAVAKSGGGEAMQVSVAENLQSMTTSQREEESMDTESCSALVESIQNVSILDEAYARSEIAQFEEEPMDTESSKKNNGRPSAIAVEANSMSVEDGTSADSSSCHFTCSICSHSFVSEIQLKDHRETHLNVQSKKSEENDSLENISDFQFCSPLCSPNKLCETGFQCVSHEVTNFH